MPPLRSRIVNAYDGKRAMALVPAGSSALCILPNLKKHSINWPHETDTVGTFFQTMTVRTVVRLGQRLPTATSMRLTMSLRDATGEITPNRVTTGKPMYNGDSNSMSQDMRPDVPPQDESDDGVARGDCVAEATFDFKFSVTAHGVHGNLTETPVWLRFTVDGSPQIYVETPPFRLVAKKDATRSMTDEELALHRASLLARKSVPTLVTNALKSTKQVLYREGH